MKTTCGCTRFVILTKRYAFKFPNPRYEWRHFLLGLLANMQEARFSTANWPELCPVVWSIRGGWLVIMRRAVELTDEEYLSMDLEAFVHKADYVVPVEAKASSFGWLDGKIVAIDYGS